MDRKARRELWAKEQLSRTCSADNARIWFPLTDTSDDADLLESCAPNTAPSWYWKEWVELRTN
jgi:hypothetical protein